MDLEFANPEILNLLFLLPVWWLLVWPRTGAGVLYARGESARSLARWWGAPAGFVLLLPRLLRTAAVVSLVLALADPQTTDVVEEMSLQGKGIGLVVDLSSSMLAEDMEAGGTRIDVARDAAVHFAERRTLDELSLVGFAARPLTRVPPTTDANLVVAGVESLEIQMVGDGTDISSALLTSVGRLMESDREPRVAVLLTDGAHNGTGVRPLMAARAAAALGVRVHAISIVGQEDSIARARREAYTRARAATTGDMRTVLSGIAEITGGEYFLASSGAELDSIYTAIDALEAPDVIVTEVESRRSERLRLLLLALALLGAETLLKGSRWGVIP
ncbi:MAG: VWA domain-containing protein [Gemmatimonas sp.]|nr:VWA domain-containing protein [Gemmatimonas sp.]